MHFGINEEEREQLEEDSKDESEACHEDAWAATVGVDQDEQGLNCWGMMFAVQYMQIENNKMREETVYLRN